MDAAKTGKNGKLEKVKSVSQGCLAKALTNWATIFDRPMTDELMNVWLESFENVPPLIMIDAVVLVTSAATRMPTPGQLTQAIERVLERTLGNPEAPRECELCGGTGWRLQETQNGRVAMLCKCANPEAKAQTEEWLAKYHSAKRFAKEERRTATPVKREAIADQKLYRAEDCPEGREFLALLAKVRGKGKS